MNTKTKLQQLEERADELYSMIENLPSLSYERGEFIAELEDIDLEIEELEKLMKMKTLKKPILNLFQSYLTDEISKRKLISELYKIEIQLTDLDNIGEKDLWFKFFLHDTLATTIANLDINEYSENMNLFKEFMQLAINNPKEFQVYFS